MSDNEVIYAEQEYSVVLDIGDNIDLKIKVYHYDKTQLTQEEIKEEARGYAEQANIHYKDSEIVEIIEVTKTLKEEPR